MITVSVKRRGGSVVALPVLAPCVHGGTDADILERCPTCGGGAKHVRECALHGRCTWEPVNPAVMDCSRCRREGLGYEVEGVSPSAAPKGVVASSSTTAGRMEWVSTATLARDAVRLAGLVPRDAVGIAGVPRSGLLPAAVMATHLHLPLYELTEEGRLNRLGHGSRGRAWGWPTAAGGPLVVVDDTSYSGGALQKARDSVARLGVRALFAVVYPRPEAAPPDLYCRSLPSPHLLEWNVANNAILRGGAANPVYRKGVAFDLDGVIVHDEESGGTAGSPYLVPRTIPVPLICTGRPEGSRAATESLLRSLGAKWDRLVMLPDGVPLTAESAAAHKAKYFAESGCGFFLESCPVQAEAIHRLSGRPVICPRAERVYC